MLKVNCENRNGIDVEKLSCAIFKKLHQEEDLELDLVFATKEEIHKLNLEYRNVDRPTDVLSFPTLDGIRYKTIKLKDYPLDLSEEGNSVYLGSIVICLDKAMEQAKEYGHSLLRELTFLLCHGMLHLMGYDHIEEKDRIEMEKLQDEIMKEIEVNR